MAHGFSCSTACGIFPDQGLNLCLLYWQVDYLPLSYQGSHQEYSLEKRELPFPGPPGVIFSGLSGCFFFFFFYVASTRGGVEGQVISVISSEPTQHTAARVPLLTTLIYTGPRKKRVLNPKLWFQLALACFTCTMYTSLSLSTFLLIFGLSHKWIPKSNRSEGKNTTI